MQSLKVISILILACLFIQTPVNGNDENGKGNLPTVFIVGAQKGGTSSLFEFMIQHPLLCGGEHKESGFFNTDANYNMGIDYFKSQFKSRKCANNPAAHFIDGSPILYDQSVWDRISSLYKVDLSMRYNLKFIALLREPVSRDVSWYKHAARIDAHAGRLFSDVKTMSETFLGQYKFISTNFSRGMYKDQLVAFTKVFRREQILILGSDKLVQNTSISMERIRKFLNIKTDSSFLKPLPHNDHMHDNGKNEKYLDDCITRHVPALGCKVRDTAGAFYEGRNRDLYAWMKSSKAKANINEPDFWPLFDDYKLIPCVNNSRSDFDKILEEDKNLYPKLKKCLYRGEKP